MAGESFNPNPTVYTPVKPTRKTDLAAQSLWINEPSQTENGADELEPIDQDEVFGTDSLE